MAIASMIVQPAPGQTGPVAERLARLGGVTVHAVTPKQEIIVVVETASLEEANLAARSIEAVPGVLGVYPSYVTVADEETEA